MADLNERGTLPSRALLMAFGSMCHIDTVHILHRPISSMMIFFSTYSISVDHFLFDEDACLTGKRERWVHGRWWYKVVHVCQDGETSFKLIASFFGRHLAIALSLVCTNGRLALMNRDRIRLILRFVPTASLLEIIVVIDSDYPILITRRIEDSTIVARIKRTADICAPQRLSQRHHMSLSILNDVWCLWDTGARMFYNPCRVAPMPLWPQSPRFCGWWPARNSMRQ